MGSLVVRDGHRRRQAADRPGPARDRGDRPQGARPQTATRGDVLRDGLRARPMRGGGVITGTLTLAGRSRPLRLAVSQSGPGELPRDRIGHAVRLRDQALLRLPAARSRSATPSSVAGRDDRCRPSSTPAGREERGRVRRPRLPPSAAPPPGERRALFGRREQPVRELAEQAGAGRRRLPRHGRCGSTAAASSSSSASAARAPTPSTSPSSSCTR